MDECCACGATNNLEYFAPETCVFGDGSRLEREALLCDVCVGATTLRRVVDHISGARRRGRQSALAS